MLTLPLKDAREALQKWAEKPEKILSVEVSAQEGIAAVSAGAL